MWKIKYAVCLGTEKQQVVGNGCKFLSLGLKMHKQSPPLKLCPVWAVGCLRRVEGVRGEHRNEKEEGGA